RLLFVFFFSSRRRHTRFSRDWSSDVCSSDLRLRPRTARLHSRRERRDRLRLTLSKGTHVGTPAKRELHLGYMYWLNGTHWGGWQIGRASCREGVWSGGGGGSLREGGERAGRR